MHRWTSAIHAIRHAVRVVFAVAVPPHRCPHCSAPDLDVLQLDSAGAAVLRMFNYRVIRCHECQKQFVTWR